VVLITSISGQPCRGWSWWWSAANPLGLTSEQMSQIQDIFSEWQEELLPIGSTWQTKNRELQRLLRDPKADPAMIEQKTREVGDLQVEIQRKLLERRVTIRDVLTDEQKSQFAGWSMGYGFGRRTWGLGMGRGRGGAFGWRRGPGWGASSPYRLGSYRLGFGQGPCGMGLGRAGERDPTQ
jgi:Spy/CpxP family protein refolding chaperone